MTLPASLILLHILINYFKGTNIFIEQRQHFSFLAQKSFLGTRDRREIR
jgi:hypothetical protein